MLPDLHTDFSRGRSGGLVFPSLSEFSTVYCDPQSKALAYNLWLFTFPKRMRMGLKKILNLTTDRPQEIGVYKREDKIPQK